ncbi:MAG: hypothetical protein E4H05_03315, partial [Acidimicrobiales bacterium]
MTLYVDSSALLKRYVDEHRIGTHQLDGDSWTDSRRQFAVDLDAFALVGPDATTCNEAAAIAERTGCRSLDALH